MGLGAVEGKEWWSRSVGQVRLRQKLPFVEHWLHLSVIIVPVRACLLRGDCRILSFSIVIVRTLCWGGRAILSRNNLFQKKSALKLC